jgi:signal transduction histidine kinase/ActR/RegA family two-component response regulator
MTSRAGVAAVMDRWNLFLLAGVVSLATAIFIADLSVPLGVAIWIPYMVVVLLSLWLPHRSFVFLTTLACSALTIGELFLVNFSDRFWVDLTNRLLAVFAFWATAFFGLAARRTAELESANTALQLEMEKRKRLEAQILHAQRLESIGVLAGGIAHDFNNLLTPIMMAAKLLREDRTLEERQHLLNTLQTSAERGADMVRQLLAFAGGSDGQRFVVQPQRIIREIQSILEHAFAKSIEIRIELAPDLHRIHANATQISQVLMNLCVNARDAMPRGGILTIRAENVVLDAEQLPNPAEDHPGPYVRLTVEDTGNGIPPEVIDKVFDPFFTTKSAGKGTGLGLSTALGIVRSHQGFIDIASPVGRGTRLSVHLPAAQEAEPRSTVQARPLPRGRGELILVVDDEANILQTVRATLEGHGYRVLTAGEGSAAVALFREHVGSIRAVVLDARMPGMDTTAIMAALEDLDPQVRVLVISGMRAAERSARRPPVSEKAFLAKPFTDEEMLTTLARVLAPDPVAVATS